MIHFNFTVTIEEAETIFDVMNNAITKCHERKLFSNTTKKESEWLDKHIKYLSSLKKKMVNQKV